MIEGRRDFIQILVLGGAGLAAFGCGGGDSSQQTLTPSCTAHGGTAASISANHGHVLAIPAAHFSDGMNHQYSILGTASHDHLVDLTAAQLAQILAGGSVTVVSSETNVHVHTIAAVCSATGGLSGGGSGGGGGYNPYP